MIDPTLATLSAIGAPSAIEIVKGLVLAVAWALMESLASFYKIQGSLNPPQRTISRPPESHFENVIETFPKNYLKVRFRGQAFRVHYLDVGEGSEVLVCLHGVPFWSQSYHKLIPHLANDYRLIVPDFVGFGRSDRLVDWRDYSVELHKVTVYQLLSQLNLIGHANLTLVGHNWGALLGMSLMKDRPNLFHRAVILNTNNLPDGELNTRRLGVQSLDFLAFNAWFLAFRGAMNLLRGLFPLKLLYKALNVGYNKKDLQEFQAPFLLSSDRGGAVSFPLFVPIFPNDRYANDFKLTRRFLATKWRQENTLIVFSEDSKKPFFDGGDFVVGNRRKFYEILMPRAKVSPRLKGGHVIMYDNPLEVAHQIKGFVQSTK